MERKNLPRQEATLRNVRKRKVRLILRLYIESLGTLEQDILLIKKIKALCCYLLISTLITLV